MRAFLAQQNFNQLLLLLTFLLNVSCSANTVHSTNKAERNAKAIVVQGQEQGREGGENSQNLSSTPSQESVSGASVQRVLKKQMTQEELQKICLKDLKSFPGQYDKNLTDEVCKNVEQLQGCFSRSGKPIYHYNRPARKPGGERILTFALTHGDEVASGAVARGWVNRLSRIDPRNEWRVIPVLNPDGYEKKTRTNGSGVDINRNYPSHDWDDVALKWWKEKKKSDPRRYPGPSAGSEPETECSIQHINDFKPDLIISVHTPLGVLDFDGPRLKFPVFSNLPWISLGTYPGSLGRYMWHDRHVPVMTIELKGNIEKALDKFDQLQDISGQVALTISQDEKRRAQKSSKD
ncbi:MAG: succinylglutamate desuccinylase/aspartoacylase family protein [Bdellovibrionales bacterium]|nr:succinylglutamate desuccinylase/aspartoacylase family protein [Bdellovibrionales bacterium]